MRTSRFLLIVALAACAAGEAREYAPRVLSPHNADAYSLKTFAQYARWRDLKPEAKMLEMYKYLADKRTGLYPMGAGAFEGRDVMYEFRFVRDPIKMINVYAMGYCDELGPTMAGVLKGVGLGESRVTDLPGDAHVTAEVFFENKWHYADLDLRLIFLRPDGTLGSMDDSKTDPACWTVPKSSWWLPCDSPDSVRKMYAKAGVAYRHGVDIHGHTMDFVLRRGETLTRWWKPQGGRWNVDASHLKAPFPKDLFEKEPRGPKCKHGSAYTIHTSGNGLFVYKPDLTSKSADFADGVYDAKNVQPGASGLTLKEPGEGYAVFEVRSPYVIVPLVGKMDNKDDDREASVYSCEAEGATCALSLDNGLTWKDLGADSTRDLTSLVSHGIYGYLLKISLKGEPGKAVLKSLELKTWVQLHPAALPSLRQGKNQMQYVTGDHYGLQTRVLEFRSEGNDKDDFFKYCSDPPRNFSAERKTSRAIGPFVARMDAPPNAKIVWFSAGGNFCTHQAGGAPNTRNTIGWAADEPKDFKQVYKAAVPAGQNHWHYNADVEVKLDAPAKTVSIQYLGDPGVNNIRMYAHCTDDIPPPATGVTIKHVWTENGAQKSQTVKLDKPGPYEIVTEAEPVDESIEMSVPGGAK